jgi:hypothetical protein
MGTFGPTAPGGAYATGPGPSARLGLPGWVWGLLGLLLGLVIGGLVGWFVGWFATLAQPVPGMSYGDEPFLDRAYDLCERGDLGACDLLFEYSEEGSEYEEFAATCGNRRTASAANFCIEEDVFEQR